MTDEQLLTLWKQFGNTPVDDNDLTEEDFIHFPAGTNKFDIWYWFDHESSEGLVKLTFPPAPPEINFVL